MAWETWSLFLVTLTALCLTPGPAVLLVISQGLTRGARASLWSNFGILLGNALYFALSASSVGAVLLASRDLFFAIRWVGAVYLVWLGVTTFLGRSRVLSVTPDTRHGGGRARMLGNGLVLQLTNPTAPVFFAALLPQFVDPRDNVPVQFAILGVTSTIVELGVLAGYGALAGRAATYATQPRFATLTNRVAGALLVTAGIGTAALRVV
jgi:threonine/homoserine/homoserine lactone efflux protein